MVGKKGVRALVVIEDERLERFCRYVLLRLGFHRRELLFFRCPAGSQDAKAWVDAEYVQRVAELRRKGYQQLLVLVGSDADTATIERRAARLATALTAAKLAARTSAEAIVHWISKRNIETWMLHLSGHEGLNERDDYKQRVREGEYDLAGIAESFVSEMRRHRSGELFSTLPSLSATYEESKRLPG